MLVFVGMVYLLARMPHVGSVLLPFRCCCTLCVVLYNQNHYFHTNQKYTSIIKTMNIKTTIILILAIAMASIVSVEGDVVRKGVVEGGLVEGGVVEGGLVEEGGEVFLCEEEGG